MLADLSDVLLEKSLEPTPVGPCHRWIPGIGRDLGRTPTDVLLEPRRWQLFQHPEYSPVVLFDVVPGGAYSIDIRARPNRAVDLAIDAGWDKRRINPKKVEKLRELHPRIALKEIVNDDVYSIFGKEFQKTSQMLIVQPRLDEPKLTSRRRMTGFDEAEPRREFPSAVPEV